MNKSWEDPFCFCKMGAEDHPWERVRDSMKHLTIEKVIGREIIDSRGNPTVEAEVYLSDGPAGGCFSKRPPPFSCPARPRAVPETAYFTFAGVAVE